VRNVTFDTIKFRTPFKAIYIKTNPGIIVVIVIVIIRIRSMALTLV